MSVKKFVYHKMFKLTTRQVVRLHQAHQVGYAMKQKRKEQSAYRLINDLERNGIIDNDTAQNLLHEVYKDDMIRRREKEMPEESRTLINSRQLHESVYQKG